MIAVNCIECDDSGVIDGESEGNYFDCPGAVSGACDPSKPDANCSHCAGKGYIVPTIKCECA